MPDDESAIHLPQMHHHHRLAGLSRHPCPEFSDRVCFCIWIAHSDSSGATLLSTGYGVWSEQAHTSRFLKIANVTIAKVENGTQRFTHDCATIIIHASSYKD